MVFKTIIEDGYPKTVLPFTLIYIDNQDAIKLIKNPKYYYKTKYLSIKHYKIRKLVNKILFNLNGFIRLKL